MHVFFCSEYRETAGLRYKKQADDGNLQLMRSAFILHGQEMANKVCDVYSGEPQFREMIRAEKWCLRARETTWNGFLSEDNWH